VVLPLVPVRPLENPPDYSGGPLLPRLPDIVPAWSHGSTSGSQSPARLVSKKFRLFVFVFVLRLTLGQFDNIHLFNTWVVCPSLVVRVAFVKSHGLLISGLSVFFLNLFPCPVPFLSFVCWVCIRPQKPTGLRVFAPSPIKRDTFLFVLAFVLCRVWLLSVHYRLRKIFYAIKNCESQEKDEILKNGP
jgi:hypothetical protein